MTALRDKRFRANPGYRLHVRDGTDRVAGAAALPDEPADDAAYGDVRPKRGVHLPSRPLSAEVALLFLTLQHAERRSGPLPVGVRWAAR